MTGTYILDNRAAWKEARSRMRQFGIETFLVNVYPQGGGLPWYGGLNANREAAEVVRHIQGGGKSAVLYRIRLRIKRRA